MTRKEAINYLEMSMAIGEDDDSRHHNEVLEFIIEVLKQEPKTGQWETSGDYFTGAYETIDYVRCSCCGYDSLEEGDYCPNCGARMKESEE